MTPLAPSGDTPARRNEFGFLRTMRRRPRLYVGAAIMIVVYFALAGAGLREATRALVAWNAGSWSFVALVLAMAARAPRSIGAVKSSCRGTSKRWDRRYCLWS